jgi:hypothetical protein
MLCLIDLSEPRCCGYLQLRPAAQARNFSGVFTVVPAAHRIVTMGS